MYNLKFKKFVLKKIELIRIKLNKVNVYLKKYFSLLNKLS